MGVVMLVGIAVSNSILIVEFTRRLISHAAGGGSDMRWKNSKTWPCGHLYS